MPTPALHPLPHDNPLSVTLPQDVRQKGVEPASRLPLRRHMIGKGQRQEAAPLYAPPGHERLDLVPDDVGALPVIRRKDLDRLVFRAVTGADLGGVFG